MRGDIAGLSAIGVALAQNFAGQTSDAPFPERARFVKGGLYRFFRLGVHGFFVHGRRIYGLRVSGGFVRGAVLVVCVAILYAVSNGTLSNVWKLRVRSERS